MVGMDQKVRCSCMYKAGIAGYYAPRAVFPSLVGRPRVLGIQRLHVRHQSTSLFLE